MKDNSFLIYFCRVEVGRIRQSSYLKAFNLALYFSSSKIILFACFVTYVYIKGSLKPEAIFVAMAYFNTMRITVTKSFPNSIACYAEASVTCKRIETFLLHEEIQKTHGSAIGSENDKNNNNGHFKMNSTKRQMNEATGIVIEKATARWNKVSTTSRSVRSSHLTLSIVFSGHCPTNDQQSECLRQTWRITGHHWVSWEWKKFRTYGTAR